MEKFRELPYAQIYLAMCNMHYYSHNIADYRKDTLGLTIIEHGAYRQLLDQYYLDEKPLPLDEETLYRLVNARNQDEKYAVRYAIKSFFNKTEDGYVHGRCEATIRAYKKTSSDNSKAGKASALKAKERKAAATTVEQPCNQPITNNHKPVTTYKGKSVRFEDFWKVWPSGERKVAKAACKSKWEEKGLDEIADKIIGHVEKMKVTDQWTRGFEPMPATYLNQKRYLDADDVDTKAGLPPNMLRKAI
jgi:uncharacterized protein YdaU (DUF1376 family)